MPTGRKHIKTGGGRAGRGPAKTGRWGQKKLSARPKAPSRGRSLAKGRQTGAGSRGESSSFAFPAAAETRRLVAVLTGIVFLAALLILYFSMAVHYRRHFFKGTVINQTQVGGLTVSEAEAWIAERAGDYRIRLSFRGNVTELIEGSSFDYAYHSNGKVARLMKEQNPLAWIRGVFVSETEADAADSEEAIDATFSLDKLKAAIDALPELQAENMEAPQDARLAFQEGKFLVEAEREGSTIERDLLYDAAARAVSKSRGLLSLEEIEGVYASPRVRQDDPELHSQADQLNDLIRSTVTYQLFNGKEVVLDGAVMKDWLLTDESGNYYKDEGHWAESMTAFIADLAAQTDTLNGSHEFNATGIGRIEISNKDYYGIAIDQYGEYLRLEQDLQSGEAIRREPVYTGSEAAAYSDNFGIGSTYIEVDLSRQHLWFYQNGSLALETDIVSGTMDQKHHTPEGIFQLIGKQTKATLRGDRQTDGTFTYETPVEYWMPLTYDGVGLHDAWWRYAFGGEIYYYSGSHGCINLPSDLADDIYGMLDYETPVVFYYSQGMELFGGEQA